MIFIEPSSSESIIEAVICMYNNKFSIIPEKQFIRSKNEQNTLKVYNEVL